MHDVLKKAESSVFCFDFFLSELIPAYKRTRQPKNIVSVPLSSLIFRHMQKEKVDILP